MRIRATCPPAILLAAFLAGAVLPSAAPAQPPPPSGVGTIALRWDACLSDGGSSLRTFACDTNSGSEDLILTATLASPMSDFLQWDARIYVCPTDYELSLWWDAGGCRPTTSVLASFVPPAGSTGCSDDVYVVAGFGTGSFVRHGASFDDSPQLGRLNLVYGTGTPISIPAGQELYLATIRINHARTVGTGSCLGCLLPVGIGIDRVLLQGSEFVNRRWLYFPAEGTNEDFVSWQSDLIPTRHWYYSQGYSQWFKYFTVTLATDTARPTWGAIKAMYR